MKKILTYLFCGYILFLVALPCMDDCHGKSEETVVSVYNSYGHMDGDECSPFCTCNCCSMPAVLMNTFSPSLVQSCSIKLNPVLTSFHNSLLEFLIWQPPKF